MAKTTKEFLAELGNRVSINDPTATVVFSNNISFANGAQLALPANVGIIANGTLGTTGQVLTTNGSAAYWGTGGGGGSVNTASPYVWTNNHTFTTNTNGNVYIGQLTDSANAQLKGSGVIIANGNLFLSGKAAVSNSEGGELSLGYANKSFDPSSMNLTNTWSIDVFGYKDNTVSTPNALRIFNYDSTGQSHAAIDIIPQEGGAYTPNKMVLGSNRFITSNLAIPFAVNFCGPIGPLTANDSIDFGSVTNKWANGYFGNVNILSTGNTGSSLTMTAGNGSVISMKSNGLDGQPNPDNAGFFTTQVDRTFAFYSTLTTGAPRPVWAVRTDADPTVPPDTEAAGNPTDKLGTGFFLDAPLVLRSGIVPYGTGSKGSNGQILVSTGNTFPGVKWADAAAASVNTASKYTWTNTHTFDVNGASNTGGINITGNAAGINATCFINQFEIGFSNSTSQSILSNFGLQANVIFSTDIRGSKDGNTIDDLKISANSKITLSTNVVFSNNISIIANNNTGTVGQVLTSTGTGVYWATVSSGGVNTAAQYTWTNTHTFSGTANINIIDQIGTDGSSLYMSSKVPSAPTANNLAVFVAQPDRSFVLYSTLTTGAVRPIWAIRTSADPNVPPDTETGNNLGTGFILDSALVLRNGIVPWGSGSKGSPGQILTSTGNTFPGVKWADAAAASVNTAAQYTWTNVHTYNANVRITTTSAANDGGIILTGNAYGINATSTLNQFQISIGNATNRSVLSAFGLQANVIFSTDIRGSKDGSTVDDLKISANSKITLSTNVVFSNNIVFSNSTSITANNTNGIQGQFLGSNGSGGVYWSGMKYMTMSNNTTYTVTSSDTGKMLRIGDGQVTSTVNLPKGVLKEGEFISIMSSASNGVTMQVTGGALFENAGWGSGAYSTTSFKIKQTGVVTLLSKDNGDLYTIVNGYAQILEFSSVFSYKGKPTITANNIWTNWPTASSRNLGNYFNPTTGLFTAPASGMYQFTATDYGNNYRNINIRNQATGEQLSSYGPNGSNSLEASAMATGTIFCNRGDTVGVYYGEITGSPAVAAGQYWMFQGTYLGLL